MDKVRAFGKELDPRDYSRGNGVLGRLIGIANRFRVALERWICRTILKIEARSSGLDKREVARLVSEVRRDPEIRPWDGDKNFYRSPKPLVRDEVRPAYHSIEERTAAHYGEGRKNAVFQAIGEGTALAATVARVKQHEDRGLRYLSRGGQQVYDLDEEGWVKNEPRE